MAGSDALKRDPRATQQGFTRKSRKMPGVQSVPARDENNVIGA
jgi:hypothetical protein